MTAYQYTLLQVTNHLGEYVNVGLVVVDPYTNEHAFVTHKNLTRAAVIVDAKMEYLTNAVNVTLETVDTYLGWSTEQPSTLNSKDPTTWCGYAGMLQFRSYYPVVGTSVLDALNKLVDTFDMNHATSQNPA